ncbi:unnamed protein product [Pleuronectes platessa]|uniref:Secreted protein n=1 Tax=Pleuronectes platessa TaxID=8262 RepID=A0A9N7V4J3_PLEPL|nr:unnamed protein product [Pleuronectes platessa]
MRGAIVTKDSLLLLLLRLMLSGSGFSPDGRDTRTFKRVSGGHPRLTPRECQALTHGAWCGDKFVKRPISASLPHANMGPDKALIHHLLSGQAAPQLRPLSVPSWAKH